jgi:hypothetical protein
LKAASERSKRSTSCLTDASIADVSATNEIPIIYLTK